jgi:PGF-pre-PGF domain-containing protein
MERNRASRNAINMASFVKQKEMLMKRFGVLIILFALCAPVCSAPAVSVEPSHQDVLQGDTFSANIMVDPEGAEVMGAQYKLYFNNKLLNATQQTQRTFLGGIKLVDDINNTIGVIEYGEFRSGSAGVATPGVLASITFQVTGERGDCELVLEDVKLSDPSAHEIANVTISNGIVSITPTTTPTPAVPQAPSGGSSGGGGGALSGESPANIELRERHDDYIFKDRMTSYHFVLPKNPVMFVNITGNSNAGEITVAVEVLHNTSSLVKSAAPGIVHKNMNIWVGTSGFATPGNIKEAIIGFYVERPWIDSSGVDPASIALMQHNLTSDTWNPLPTQRTGENEAELHYQAATDSFSPSAITGEKKSVLVSSATATAIATETAIATPANESGSPPASENKKAGAGFIGLIAVAAAVYVKAKRRR